MAERGPLYISLDAYAFILISVRSVVPRSSNLRRHRGAWTAGPVLNCIRTSGRSVVSHSTHRYVEALDAGLYLNTLTQMYTTFNFQNTHPSTEEKPNATWPMLENFHFAFWSAGKIVSNCLSTFKRSRLKIVVLPKYKYHLYLSDCFRVHRGTCRFTLHATCRWGVFGTKTCDWPQFVTCPQSPLSFMGRVRPMPHQIIRGTLSPVPTFQLCKGHIASKD